LAHPNARAKKFTGISQKNWSTVKDFDGVIRARFYATEASDASLLPINELRYWKLPFRVVAPPAMKRTPLEEHGRPDTWAIVSGKFYYIKNCSNNLFDIVFTMPLLVESVVFL
jgi:hypothetical protein